MEIIAHRGASHTAPENTLAAARLAWEEGADALELDVRLTAGGQLAVVHDEDTRRLGGDVRAIGETTLAELRRLDAGQWKHARYRGEKIPTLAEMLAQVPLRKRVFIEVKNGPEAVAPLQRDLRNSGLSAKQVVIISFNFLTVLAAKAALPGYEVAWILDAPRVAQGRTLAEAIHRSRAAQLDALDLSARWPIDAANVAAIHEAGLKVYVWTVDQPALALRFFHAGVDGLATNRPGWLRAQLKD